MIQNQLTLLTLMPPLNARAAVEADRNFLLQLEEGCMREYVVALWGEWRPRPPELSLIEGCQIILDSGLSIGCISLYWNDDHIWIDRLYLKKSHQRLGIGSTVLKYLKKEAYRCGIPIRLAVLVNSAFLFYERAGFNIDYRDSELYYMSS